MAGKVSITRPDNKRVHEAAVFYAAAELARRDFRIDEWLPGETDADLLATGRKGKQILVRAKGKFSTNWQAPIDLPAMTGFPNAARFVIFVDIDPRTAPAPAFWIVPEKEVLRDIRREHRAYLKRHRGRRPRNPASKHHQIEARRLIEWRDAWDLLDELHR